MASRMALAVLVSILALAGCGDDDDGGRADLNWFVATQPGGVIQANAKRCTEESGGRYKINLELLPTNASQQREQLVRRLGAEDSNIDIIGMDVIWTAEFANAGWLEEWTGALADEVTKGIFPSVIDTATFENKLYGAPFNSNTQVLFFRTDRVSKPPATWDQMIEEAERLGADGKIQVQANFYEGFTVWVTAMLNSAGAQILAGPTEVSLEEEPSKLALSTMGRLGGSSAAPANIDTSDEGTAVVGFEAGGSSFMLNYPFAYASANANAPDVFKNMGVAKYPQVTPDLPSAPPLGGFNLGISKFSENTELAFEAAACLANSESQLTATELDGLPPTRESLYDDPIVKKAYPGFAEVIRRSVRDGVARPQTPAYTDLSLAIQRALHPVGDIDPQDPDEAYDKLRESLEDAVKREGLL